MAKDQALLGKIKELMPKHNPVITRGLATTQMKHPEQYVDYCIRSIASSFPPGLVYDGYAVCDPKTQFLELSKQRDGQKRRVELAKSDFFLVRYDFLFYPPGSSEAIKLRPCYLLLPTVDEGGILSIRGKRYSISPVLSDPAISIGPDYIFVPLNKKRLNFERTHQHYHINDEVETTYVVWSWVHSNAKRKSASKRVVYSTMIHYLFTQYGVTKTFENVAGANIVIGNEEINESTYPRDEWCICYSTGIKPKVIKSKEYTQSRLRLAIPKHQLTETAKNLIGGFFYIVDHFPDRVEAQYVDNVRLWKVLLGIIINGSGASEGLLVNEIDHHLTSICELYVDHIDKENFAKAGLRNITNIFELFTYAIEFLSHQQLFKGNRISSLYGKRLVTMKYALFDVVRELNYIVLSLRNAQGKKKVLDEVELNNILAKHFKHTAAFKMTGGDHGEITTISTSCDNMFVGITSTMIPQEDANPQHGGKSRITLSNQARHLDVSLAEIASYNVLPKALPTGHGKVSPYIKLDPTGSPIRNKELAKLLDFTQTQFKA